jgi:two-component system, OmpR family, KDP operon response regulator KdpE
MKTLRAIYDFRRGLELVCWQFQSRFCEINHMNPMKILVVDDEPQIRRSLRATLTSAGYVVVEARSGEEAIEELQAGHIDMVLLDLLMPGMGGTAACRQIRKLSDVSIIVISVCRNQSDKVSAFDAGADDYIAKPFGIQELLSRIRALRRRTSGVESTPPFISPGLEIDFERRRVVAGGEPVHLTPTEFDLLRHLVLNPGKPLSHQALLESICGSEHAMERWRLRVFINQLRKKIEPNPSHPLYIHTEPLIGYKFEAPGTKLSKPPKGNGRVKSRRLRDVS